MLGTQAGRKRSQAGSLGRGACHIISLLNFMNVQRVFNSKETYIYSIFFFF